MNDNTLQTIIDQFSLLRLVLALGFLGVTWGGLTLLKKVIDRLAERFARYRLFISSAYPVVRLVIWIGALAFVVVVIFAPPLNTVLTIGASAGLAIGLGAQDLVKNLIAGILILVDRPFKVGDMIRTGEHYGEVKRIGLRATRILTFGDSLVSLPNALILGQAVSNSNSGALDELVEVEFSLPGRQQPGPLRELAWQAAVCSPYAYLRKPVTVVVEDHFDRRFLTRLRVKVYVVDIRYERALASDVTERFKQALADRGFWKEVAATDLVPVPVA